MCQLPKKACASCQSETELPIVLIGEVNGQSVLIFAGVCKGCKMIGKTSPVYYALAIGRKDYLQLLKQGIKIAGGTG